MSDFPPIPFPRSYWVLPGRLLAGPYPGDLRPQQAATRLAALVACGIRRVINLMEEDEVNAQGLPFVPYIEPMRRLAAGDRVEWSRHPIRDGSIPTRPAMRRILDEIDASLQAGRPVYVHCWGGKGRTGTVVGCYLLRHHLSTREEVLDRIVDLRRAILPYQPSPETAEQCDFVCAWHEEE